VVRKPRHDTERDLSFTDTISHTGRRIAAAAMLAALALIALLALRPAPASASTSEWSFFEDHSYLVRSTPTVRQNTLDEIMTQYGAKVRVVPRDFPLDFHNRAMSASRAVHCASATCQATTFEQPT